MCVCDVCVWCVCDVCVHSEQQHCSKRGYFPTHAMSVNSPSPHSSLLHSGGGFILPPTVCARKLTSLGPSTCTWKYLAFCSSGMAMIPGTGSCTNRWVSWPMVRGEVMCVCVCVCVCVWGGGVVWGQIREGNRCCQDSGGKVAHNTSSMIRALCSIRKNQGWKYKQAENEETLRSYNITLQRALYKLD